MIICEISQNFSNLSEARELVYLAKENGGDIVKAQLFDSLKLYGRHTPSELSFEQAKMLFDYGNEVGIEVFFSVFDVERVRWCEEIGVKRYKIACGMRDTCVLSAVYNTNKSIIVSARWDFPIDHGYGTSIYCPEGYPQSKFKMPDFLYRYDVGFSDHTIGIDVAKIALAREAEIIEKHFCIDHQTGIDAEWSMTPMELAELVRWQAVCKEVL